MWDNEEKCYQESDADYCRINYNGELECMFTYDNGIGCRYEYIQDHCIIEQCTGLRDKNGTLIYEGDIVGNGNGPLRIVVVWKNVYWGYYADGSFHALSFWVNELEIIGNIHEVNI